MKNLTVFTLLLIITTAFSLVENPGEISNNRFDINDYEWLVGSWKGDGFGGISEEVWSEPVDGTMMGMYRHYKDGKLNFYEFLLLDETGLRLKHFHPDLKGWEEKDDMVFFEMIESSPNKITMKGLTFEKKSDSLFIINLKMKRGDKIETEVFTMKKQKD